MLPIPLLALALATLAPSLASAFSFQFTSTPQQCSGQPPYSVVIIPFGPSPLPNNIEARKIFQTNFTGSSVSFKLNYPANSQFVAVMSDTTGYGSGGTSVAANVMTSSDSSCFDATTNVAPPFTFKMDPPSTLVQCQATRLWWDPSQVQSTPTFTGVIPGGESFSIPQGTITDQSANGTGTGFSWTPSIRGGTTVMIVAGDSRGPGSGGSVLFTVSSGPNNDGSCLSNSSPSSTPGSPAGGSYPTSSTGAGTGNSNSSTTTTKNGTNIGAIVGGVIGGVVFLLALGLFLLYLLRRKQFQQTQKERPVDLLQDDENADNTRDHEELPQFYRPEPFIVPDPTEVSSAGAQEDGSGAGSRSGAGAGVRRISTATTSTMDNLGVLGGLGSGGGSSNHTRKSARPPELRPVNIVQHEDAGPPPGQEPEDVEPETVELPPAYTNIRR
ncbi:hypothetical protein JAAARDRAFT_47090 [Jaapia argillacea MUCL 33604]|uniref:Mid2 domain-containing protein n=1 Tax=Jaapia argillacea MUCL 33604 TaxID=933084 RepID=A0A067PV93_9AGAM|nr:hypothetical protein JAAARDRAFT_47090 [Jaapia argillacea MUCL 33604]